MTDTVYEYQTINKLDYNEFIKEVVHAVHSDGWERYGEPQDLITTMGTLYSQELRKDVAPEILKSIHSDNVRQALTDLDNVVDETEGYINPHKFLRRPTSGEVGMMVEAGMVDPERPADTIMVEDELDVNEDGTIDIEYELSVAESDEMEDNQHPPEEDSTSTSSLKYYVVTGLDVHTIGERINQEVRKGWKVDGDLIVTRLTDDSVKYTQRLVK